MRNRYGFAAGVLYCFDSGNSSSSSTSVPQQPTASSTGTNAPAIANSGTLTMSDNGAVQSALDAINKTVTQTITTLQDVVAQNAQQVAANQDTVSTLANTALAANQTLATDTNSQGQTETNKTILYVIGAALAALVIVVLAIFSGRKK